MHVFVVRSFFRHTGSPGELHRGTRPRTWPDRLRSKAVAGKRHAATFFGCRLIAIRVSIVNRSFRDEFRSKARFYIFHAIAGVNAISSRVILGGLCGAADVLESTRCSENRNAYGLNDRNANDRKTTATRNVVFFIQTNSNKIALKR